MGVSDLRMFGASSPAFSPKRVTSKEEASSTLTCRRDKLTWSCARAQKIGAGSAAMVYGVPRVPSSMEQPHSGKEPTARRA